jgi:hypothetical protein
MLVMFFMLHEPPTLCEIKLDLHLSPVDLSILVGLSFSVLEWLQQD